jgi:hypothetical protein
MKSKVALYLVFVLALLIGSHETILSFGLVEVNLIERSEEVPSKESEEHTLTISARLVRLSIQNSISGNFVPSFYESSFRRLVANRPPLIKSHLHILFLSLRH